MEGGVRIVSGTAIELPSETRPSEATKYPWGACRNPFFSTAHWMPDKVRHDKRILGIFLDYDTASCARMTDR